MLGQSINNNCNFIELQSFLMEATQSIVGCPKDISKFAGFNYYEQKDINTDYKCCPQLSYVPQHIILPHCSFKVINELLCSQEVHAFKKIYSQLIKQVMARNAVQLKFKSDINGIKRASIYDYQLAFYLFSKIFPYLETTKIIDGELYIACQLNPLLRFIEYQHNNSLVPHYDTAVRINDNIVSASTVIFYFTNNTLGKTRIINESVKNPHNIHNDEILYQISPAPGKCIIFDHNIFHDSSQFHKTEPQEDNKLILTTEILYYKLSEKHKTQLNF